MLKGVNVVPPLRQIAQCRGPPSAAIFWAEREAGTGADERPDQGGQTGATVELLLCLGALARQAVVDSEVAMRAPSGDLEFGVDPAA
ncbi:MAG TPA: hypothetical protein DDY14_09010 [Chromatiaceae bacterium]|jgi:hypothetical protein|nr:MAG: hypothetical protein N838_31955 [Thiohalocapsa sp. PB-PSB1]HBG95444.1 hypothetical protein [Chromatiaceae bacterium]